jgi:hypothetical protein
LQTVPVVIRKKKQATLAAKALLPTLPEDPIASLHHNVIREFDAELRDDLLIRGAPALELATLQQSLIRDLCFSLPALIPLFKKDGPSLGSLRTELGKPMGTISNAKKMWMEDVLQLRKE